MGSNAQSIQDHIVTTLKAINGGSTYQNSIALAKQVDAIDAGFTDYPEDSYPHFSVVMQNEVRRKEIGNLYSVITFQIVCTFKSTINNPTSISSWLSDIEVALAQDITRGKKAIETWIPQIDRDNGAFDPFRVYYITVECHSVFNYNDPT